MDLYVLLSYALACFLVIIVPGPSVTVIIANSLRSGSRAGLANVFGTQAGLLSMILVLALSLDFVITSLGAVFWYLKLIGAAYLIWLGIKLIRSDGALGDVEEDGPARSLSGYFWQGFLVVWSNPKALFFFGAFIPQFINPVQNTVFQTIVLGLIFVAIATICDSLYALAASKARGMLARNKIRILERISGTLLIGGGLWLAFTKRT